MLVYEFMEEGSLYEKLFSQVGLFLIDWFYTGKLGDFGFTREFPLSTKGHTIVTTAWVAKSLGYSPPEMDTCHLSPKSDVYSYGIVSSSVT